MLLAVGNLYQVEEGHLYAMFAKNFYHKRANFSVFFIYWCDCMIFFLFVADWFDRLHELNFEYWIKLAYLE